MKLGGQDAKRANGYAMAVLLVSMAVMAVLWTMAIPVWKQAMQREREEELVFRGRQYARAIGLYQRKFANAYPPNLEVLLNQKFLRRKYRDPMAIDKTGDFQLLFQTSQAQGPSGPGQVAGANRPGSPQTAGPAAPPQSAAGTPSAFAARGGIVGVSSKNKAKSIRLYNGRNHYHEWQFLYTPLTQAPGGGIGGPPGMQGRPGVQGMPGMPGGRSTSPSISAPPPSRPPQ